MTSRATRHRCACLILAVAATPAAAQQVPAPEMTDIANLTGLDARFSLVAPSGLVFYTTDGAVRVLDPRTGRTALVDSGFVGDLAISRRGDRLAFSRGEGFAHVWTLAVDERTGRAIGPPRRLSVRSGRAPTFSPAGDAVAFTVLPATDTAGPRIVRVPVAGGPERVLATEPGFAQDLRWSPDGRWIYYRHAAAGVRTIRRVSAAGGTSQRIGDGVQLFDISPDGGLLAWQPHPAASGRRAEILVTDTTGREIARFLQPAQSGAFRWSAERDRMTGARSRGLYEIHHVDMSGRGTRLPLAARLVAMPQYSPDGRSLAYWDVDTAIIVLDLATHARRRYEARGAPGVYVRWSADSRHVAYRETGNSRIRAIELATGTARTAAVCDGTVEGFQWTDAGLLFACRVGDALEVRRSPPSGGATSRLLRTFRREGTVWLLPDTLVAFVTRDRIDIASLERTTERTVFDSASGFPLGRMTLALSPDGRWFAVMTNGALTPQPIRLVPVAGGEVIGLALPPIAAVPLLEWAADGRSLIVGGEGQNRAMEAWSIPVTGGPPVRLDHATNLPFVAIAPAPDGRSIVYMLDVGLDLRAVSVRLALPGAAEAGR